MTLHEIANRLVDLMNQLANSPDDETDEYIREQVRALACILDNKAPC